MSAGTIAHSTQRPGPAEPRVGVRAGAADPAVLAACGLTVVAAILRFVGIGHQGFWFDEANTALLVHFSPGQMIGLIPRSESTPPLYYCLAWVWARLFGYGEAPLRSLSAVAGVATVPVAFATARKLFSARIGVVLAALVAFNPLLIWYSQEARSYALLVLLSSCSLLTFAYAREDPSPRRLAAWVVACALVLATHYYAVLIVVPEAVWLLGVHRRERTTLVAVGLVGVCGAALIPLALNQEATGRGNWIAGAPLGKRLSQVVPQFTAGFQLPGGSVLIPLACVLAGAGIVLAARRGEDGMRRRVYGVAGVVLGGLIINLVLVAGGVDDLLTRNLLPLWLPAALLVAAGLGTRRAGLAGVLAVVALCGIGVTGALGVLTNRNFERPDWRGVARVLGARPGPGVGERAIVIQHYRDLLPLSLYLPGLKFSSRHGGRVRELDVISFVSPPSGGFCWWGPACNLWPSAAQASYPIPGFREVWRRRVYQFTVVRLVADRPVRVTQHAVARILTTTRFRNDELLLQR